MKSGHDIEQIKKLTIIAIASDDALMERLVLKGGNALDLVHKIGSRASVDLDYSMEGDFTEDELQSLKGRLEFRLKQAFAQHGYHIFDLLIEEKPPEVTPDLQSFWGGYQLEFKLIERSMAEDVGLNLDEMRRRAIPMAPRGRSRIEVDISKFECCDGKVARQIENYTVYVYSAAMIACEKIRAICQQMPEYKRIVKNRPKVRSRDFLDIYDIATLGAIDFRSDDFLRLLDGMFRAKRVPLELIQRIRETREFHRSDWESVKATVHVDVELKPFDFYFDYVVDLCDSLQALRDV